MCFYSRYRPPVNLVPGSKICVEVCGTETIADIQWQDGTIEQDVKSTELHPVYHLDELEFFPGDFVIDKRGIHLSFSLRSQFLLFPYFAK